MDSDDTDDEQLPTRVDSDVDHLESEEITASFKSSEPVTNDSSPQTPTSPGYARKRTNDEVYAKVEERHATTTLQRSPKSIRGKSYAAIVAESSAHTQSATSTPQKIPIRAFGQQPTIMNPFTEQRSADAADIEDMQSPKDFFTREVDEFETHLQAKYNDYEDSIRASTHDSEFDELDWRELEERYSKAIQPKMEIEQEIMNEIAARFQQLQLWMQIASQREAERGIKRLRTKMAYVQNSEDQLSQRQEHYNKVLDAFQNAMALLGNL